MKTVTQIQNELSYSDVYSIDDFRENVKHGSFNLYDGDGYLHDGEEETDINVWDIDIFEEQYNRYPYVCWYNK